MSLSAELDRLRILCIRDLLVHPLRHLVSIGVVTVCSGLLVAVLGIYGSIVGSVDDLVRDVSGDVSLQVTANSSGGVPDELLRPIRRVRGVEVASPIVLATVQVAGRPTLILGVDPSMSGINSRLGRTVLDQSGASAVIASGGIIVGPRLGVAAGGSIDAAGHRLDVAKVLEQRVGVDLNGGRFIIAPLRIAQAVIARPGAFDSILIVTGGDAATAQVRRDIDRITQGRVITSEPLLAAARNGTILLFLRNAILICASLALVVGMFLVFNTLNMAIIRRRPTFAMMRAVGAQQSAIRRHVLGEALLVGLIGGVLGVPLGIVAGWSSINRLPPAIVQSVQATVAYHLPAYAIPIAISVSVVSCAGAALGGVRLSARLSPIEAVGRADIRQMDQFRQPGRAAVAVISAILLVGATYAALVLDDAWALVACVTFIVGGLGLCYAFATLLVAAVVIAAERLGRAGAAAALVIARARGRVWVTVMVIIVGVAVGICGSGAMSNLVSTASTLTGPLRTVPLIVSAAGGDQLPTGPILPGDLRSTIGQVPGVSKVVAAQYAYGTLEGKRVLLQGTVPEALTLGFQALGESTRDALFRGDGVVVSRQLSKLTGRGIGDTVALSTPTGQRSARVLGIIDYLTVDAGLVVMPLDTLRQWYARPGETYLEVYLRDGTATATVEQAVADVLPGGVVVATGQDTYDAAMRAVAQVGALSAALQLIIAVVVTVGIFNTFLLAVTERRREIAVFRAIGARPRFVVDTVLAEAAAIGLIGGLAGTVIGLLTQYIGVTVLSASIGLTIQFDPKWTFLLYPVVAVLLSMAAAGGAAVLAARLAIVETIDDS